MYSCKCGWIDWTHANPGNVRGLWSDHRRIFPPKVINWWAGGGFRVTYSVGMRGDSAITIPRTDATILPVARYTRSYLVNLNCVDIPSRLDAISMQRSIALAIFQETQEGFEQKLQGGWPYRMGNVLTKYLFRHPKLMKAMHDTVASSFSEEDLPSDWIAFYSAVKNYSPATIRKICGVPDDPDEAIALSQAVWHGTDGLGKNYEWQPFNHNGYAITSQACCDDPGTKYLEWPDELNDIQPLPQGTCWKDWPYGEDYLYNPNMDDFTVSEKIKYLGIECNW